MKVYIIDKKTAPFGYKCEGCEAMVLAGDVVLAKRLRVRDLHATNWRYLGWIVYHKSCLRALLDEAPTDNYETIRERALAGNFL